MAHFLKKYGSGLTFNFRTNTKSSACLLKLSRFLKNLFTKFPTLQICFVKLEKDWWRFKRSVKFHTTCLLSEVCIKVVAKNVALTISCNRFQKSMMSKFALLMSLTFLLSLEASRQIWKSAALEDWKIELMEELVQITDFLSFDESALFSLDSWDDFEVFSAYYGGSYSVGKQKARLFTIVILLSLPEGCCIARLLLGLTKR